MSQPDSDDGQDPPTEIIETIIEFKAEIESNKNLIEAAFQQNLKRQQYSPSSDEVVFGVAMALAKDLNGDDARQVSSALLNYISMADIELVRTLQSQDLTEDLIDFLVDMCVKYGSDVEQIIYIESQGNQFWNKIFSDLVVRQQENVPGFSHRITLGYGEEVRIDADIDSNLRLIRYLIAQGVRALDAFQEEAASQIDPVVLNNIVEALDDIRTQLEEHSPNGNSEGGHEE